MNLFKVNVIFIALATLVILTSNKVYEGKAIQLANLEICEFDERLEIVRLDFKIREDLLIQANDPENLYQISTEFNILEKKGISIVAIDFKGERSVSTSEGIEWTIYKDMFQVELYVNKEFSRKKERTLSAELYFQACKDNKCYFPDTYRFDFVIDLRKNSGYCT